MNATTDTRTPWGKVVALALLVTAVIAIIVLAFAWPGVTANPRDVPVGAVGSAEQVDVVSSAIEQNAEGAIALQPFDTRDEAVAAIERREIYGAVVLPTAEGEAPEVLKATAASPQIAQLMTGLADHLQTQVDAQVKAGIEAKIAEQSAAAAAAMKDALAAVAAGKQPTLPEMSADPVTLPTVTVLTTDIAPYASTDPRGAGFSAAMFPLIIGGIAGGVALSLGVTSRRRRFVGVLLYSAFAGLTLAAILQGWFGALQGSFVINASALGLAVGAIAALVTGLYSLAGMAGIPLAVIVLFFLGNPLSGAALPPEFIVGAWGQISQWLPPGAAVTLIRNLSYFPEADTLFPWLVLAGWFVLGIVLTIAGHARGSSNAERSDAGPAEEDRVAEGEEQASLVADKA